MTFPASVVQVYGLLVSKDHFFHSMDIGSIGEVECVENQTPIQMNHAKHLPFCVALSDGFSLTRNAGGIPIDASEAQQLQN
jgi:hypothetical protein